MREQELTVAGATALVVYEDSAVPPTLVVVLWERAYSTVRYVRTVRAYAHTVLYGETHS